MILQYINVNFRLDSIEIRIKNQKFANKLKELNKLEEIPSNSKE